MKAALDKSTLLPAISADIRPRTSVVIVVWNAKKYVFECLDSMRRCCESVYDEVIVVDNASTDGTPEMIASMFPEFTLIRNPENLGFAKANNIGIDQSSGELVCLVNSDVKFTGDCLSPMIRYAEENPSIVMLGPKALDGDGKVRRSTMRFPTLWNYLCRALSLDTVFKRSRMFGGLLMWDFDHEKTAPVEVLNGWFLLVRRSAIQQVGLLDTQFFMYGEDVDWCYRFRESGQRIVFFADAEAIHYGGGSSSNAPLRFYLEMRRAEWQFWRKHHGLLSSFAFVAILGVHHLVRLLGFAAAYLVRPSQRQNALVKLRRNLAGLQWLSTLKITGDLRCRRESSTA